MNEITNDEIDAVLRAIRDGQTMPPVKFKRCGSILLECYRLGLLVAPRRAVPLLTEAAIGRIGP